MKKKIAILGSTGSIGKTLINIIKQDKEIPYFEICSYTTYKRFHEKLEEFKECCINFSKLIPILDEKLIYTTICDKDRLKKQDWFNNSAYKKCYTTNG